MCELPVEMQNAEVSSVVDTLFTQSDIIVHEIFNRILSDTKEIEEIV